MQPLRYGAEGAAVADVRRVLAGLGLLGNLDSATERTFDTSAELAVRHFQQRRGLSVDGVVGPETFAALNSARWRLGDRVLAYNATTPMAGDDVTALQVQLMEIGYDLVRADGLFSGHTQEALRAFQRDYGLVPDGYAARIRSGRYDSSADASSGAARNCCATWWPSPKRAHDCSVSGSYSIRDTVEKTPACTTRTSARPTWCGTSVAVSRHA